MDTWNTTGIKTSIWYIIKLDMKHYMNQDMFINVLFYFMVFSLHVSASLNNF